MFENEEIIIATEEAEATPLNISSPGKAFEVSGSSKKNTSSTGGIIMMIIIAVAFALVLEWIISFFVKAKRRHDDKHM